MPGQEISPDEIEAALRHIEVAAVAPDDVRKSAHAAMKQAFLDTRAGRESTSQIDGGDALVIELTDERDQPNKAFSRRLRMAMAAAAMVGIVGLGVLGLAGLGDRTSETITAAPVIERLVDGAGPVELAPGDHSFEDLGTLIEFTSDRPLWVDRADTGILELVVDPSDPGSGRLAIFRTEAGLGPLTAAMSDTSRVAANPVIDGVAGLPANVWAYKVNDDYAAAQGCAVGATCVVVVSDEPSQGLAAGPGGFIYRVDQGEYRPMMLITWAPSTVRNPQAANSDPFETLIDSLRFGSAKPGP